MAYDVNTYQEYVTYLRKYVEKNGGMTDYAIQEFLNSNALTKRFGITIVEVKNDLEAIKRRKGEGILAINLIGGTPGKIRDSRSYEFLISESGKNQHKLTVKHLEDLIYSNRLNISVYDVVADIREYSVKGKKISNQSFPQPKQIINNRNNDSGKKSNNVIETKLKNLNEYITKIKEYSTKYKDRAYLDSSIERFAIENGLNRKFNNYKDEIRKDVFNINFGGDPISMIAKSFEKDQKEDIKNLSNKFQCELISVLEKYGDRIKNIRMFKGILWDCFPENKKEINILIQLLEFGIVNDIEQRGKVDMMYKNKYSYRLTNECGIDSMLAKEMTEILCSILTKS